MQSDSLGVRLIKAMRKAELRSFELAVLVDISPSSISQFRMDRRQPQLDGLVQICRVLNCSADYLLGLTENMERL